MFILNASCFNFRDDVRSSKEQPSYPNKRLDHLGRKQRSLSINVETVDAMGLKVPPPGYSEVTVVDDITGKST